MESHLDIAGLILLVLNAFTFLLLGRAIFSWFDPGFSTSVGKLLFDITEPIVAPVRSVMPQTGMIDLSILVTMLLVFLLRTMVMNVFYG